MFSFELEAVAEVDVMANISKVTLPVFWIEEGLDLNKTFTNLLKYQLFL